jgi:hypothetical protein
LKPEWWQIYQRVSEATTLALPLQVPLRQVVPALLILSKRENTQFEALKMMPRGSTDMMNARDTNAIVGYF